MTNPMKNIRIEKIVLNIGCGTTGSLEHAKKILQILTNRDPMIVRTKKRSTFNVPKGREMGCMVTIRSDTHVFLKRMFKAKENSIKSSSFDKQGNFAFGIPEYIDIPGMEYDPKIGILGMDVCVTLVRPGYRVKKKKINTRVGKNHVIKKDEAIKFVSENFGVQVTTEEKKHES